MNTEEQIIELVNQSRNQILKEHSVICHICMQPLFVSTCGYEEGNLNFVRFYCQECDVFYEGSLTDLQKESK